MIEIGSSYIKILNIKYLMKSLKFPFDLGNNLLAYSPNALDYKGTRDFDEYL